MKPSKTPQSDRLPALDKTFLEYQSMLDNTSTGILFCRDGKLVHNNAAMTTMFGWKHKELATQSASVLYPSEQAWLETGRMAASALKAGKSFSTEKLMRRRNGSTFWCHIRVMPVKLTDRSKGIIFFAEDITDHKNSHQKIEARAKQHHQKLAAANELLKTEIKQRHAIEAEARDLALHDPLTGLPNRRLLEDRLNQALLNAKRNHTQVAIQFIDLARFRHVNDTLGHEAGDELLKMVAKRLRGAVREVDTISRIDAEFVAVLSDMYQTRDAADVAEKILKSLAQPFRIAGQELTITPSIGISVYPADGTDTATLIEHADIALRRARMIGHRNFQSYSGETANN